jgi:hypothetical protein
VEVSSRADSVIQEGLPDLHHDIVGGKNDWIETIVIFKPLGSDRSLQRAVLE